MIHKGTDTPSANYDNSYLGWC